MKKKISKKIMEGYGMLKSLFLLTFIGCLPIHTLLPAEFTEEGESSLSITFDNEHLIIIRRSKEHYPNKLKKMAEKAGRDYYTSQNYSNQEPIDELYDETSSLYSFEQDSTTYPEIEAELEEAFEKRDFEALVLFFDQPHYNATLKTQIQDRFDLEYVIVTKNRSEDKEKRDLLYSSFLYPLTRYCMNIFVQAAAAEDFKIMKSFFEKKGFNPLRMNEEKTTALHEAIKNNNDKMVGFIIDHCKKGVNEAEPETGSTVLHYAAQYNRPQIMQKYLRK